jgi:hypothetical protein
MHNTERVMTREDEITCCASSRESEKSLNAQFFGLYLVF